MCSGEERIFEKKKKRPAINGSQDNFMTEQAYPLITELTSLVLVLMPVNVTPHSLRGKVCLLAWPITNVNPFLSNIISAHLSLKNTQQRLRYYTMLSPYQIKFIRLSAST